MLRRFNPFTQLRAKLGLVVFGAIGLLAVFMSAQFSDRLAKAHHDAVRSQLQSIAATWDGALRGADLESPVALRRGIERLKLGNPNLQEISIVTRDRTGRALVVHEGDDRQLDGVTRGLSAPEVRAHPGYSEATPANDGQWGYREVDGPDGAHYGELSYPIRRDGAVAAAVELHYDLKGLSASLARDKRVLWTASGLVALSLAMLVCLILGRAVLSPLSQLRRATQRIGRGDVGMRLRWNRGDEIGVLARDFDSMAEQLQSARSHLEALALEDPLTGLLNHRALQERVSQELRRAEREGYSVAVVALDVDHFKQINDRWGHAAGDDGLRLLAKAIQTELRPSDICGRVGGDEFMFAVVRAQVKDADRIVERLRSNLAKLEVGPAGQTLTISAGISEFPRHSLSRDELMHLADGAMYWAKSSGRNRTFIYSSESDFALSAQEAADRAAHEGLVNTVHALAKAVDAKDGYTHSHSQRVARYAATLAEALDMAAPRVEMIRTAGVLHDVGKIGISDILLLKPGAFSEGELQVMRRHSELGRDIIAGAGMHEIAELVLRLHERWDGKGYPDGLSGEEIPFESRILHVADTLEAMTSSRVYRTALLPRIALEELERYSGTQFDPKVATAMLELVRSGGLDMGAEEPAKATAAESGRPPPAASAGRSAGWTIPRRGARSAPALRNAGSPARTTSTADRRTGLLRRPNTADRADQALGHVAPRGSSNCTSSRMSSMIEILLELPTAPVFTLSTHLGRRHQRDGEAMT